MKFETVRIYFLSDFLSLLSSNNFATMTTWLNDFSPLLSLNLHSGAVNWNFQRDGEGGGGRGALTSKPSMEEVQIHVVFRVTQYYIRK